jgi:hypothetical protein
MCGLPTQMVITLTRQRSKHCRTRPARGVKKMARARGSRARPKSEVRVAGDRRTAVSCGQPFGQPTRSAVGCGDEREPGGGVSVGHDADKLAKRLTTPRQPQSNGADGHTDNFGNLLVACLRGRPTGPPPAVRRKSGRGNGLDRAVQGFFPGRDTD